MELPEKTMSSTKTVNVTFLATENLYNWSNIGAFAQNAKGMLIRLPVGIWPLQVHKLASKSETSGEHFIFL